MKVRNLIAMLNKHKETMGYDVDVDGLFISAKNKTVELVPEKEKVCIDPKLLDEDIIEGEDESADESPIEVKEKGKKGK